MRTRMMRRSALGFALCAGAGLAAVVAGVAEGQTQEQSLAGQITGPAGAVVHAFVSVASLESGVTTTVLTNGSGRYALPILPPGRYALRVTGSGFAPGVDTVALPRAADLDMRLARVETTADQLPSSAVLALLPEGQEKRRFILDCTGCHQLTRKITHREGRPKTLAEWAEFTRMMLSFAGHESNFPVISAARDPERTADWLVQHLTAEPAPLKIATPGAERMVLTEYLLPRTPDLPHDLAVDGEGRVVITGMFTHQMYVLDPASGRFTEHPIPVRGANPRAVDIDSEGRWWVLLGAPKMLASYQPEGGEWRTHEIGMYPHDIDFDEQGRIWFNGHFTRDPELLGSFSPQTGEVKTYPLPSGRWAEDESPIPYGLRVAPDGTLWGTELAGNRLLHFDPTTGAFEAWPMPTPHSGPRRLDIDRQGVVWIPEYAGNSLTRFDPATKSFRGFPLPVPDALPYVTRVDDERGIVWTALAGADAIAAFDPVTTRFTIYPLPDRTTLVRHLDIDPRTGAVWAAYGQAPAEVVKIVRLELR